MNHGTTDLKLTKDYLKMLKLLREARSAIGSEIAASGDDWETNCILRDKAKLMDRIDAFLKTQ